MADISHTKLAKHYKKAEDDIVKQEGCFDKINNIIKDKRFQVY